MLPELGTKIQWPVAALRLVRRLEEFEGPILSEFRAPSGALYLKKWCAREGDVVRSLLVRTEQRAVAQYLAGRVSMLDLLTKPSDDIGIILDESRHEVAAWLVNVTALPPKYLPQPQAVHDEALRPHWENTPQSFLLDDNWNAGLLAKAERLYLDAFSFGYFSAAGTPKHFPETVFSYSYDGGYPIMHAFGTLRSSVPKSERARSVGVSANSPGVLTIDAPSDTATVVLAGLRALSNASHAYATLHAWSRLRPQKAQHVPVTAYEDVDRLCRILSIATRTVFPAEPGNAQGYSSEELLVAGKLIAAYCRKLRKLLDTESGFEFLGRRTAGGIPLSVSAVNIPDDDEDWDDDDA